MITGSASSLLMLLTESPYLSLWLSSHIQVGLYTMWAQSHVKYLTDVCLMCKARYASRRRHVQTGARITDTSRSLSITTLI